MHACIGDTSAAAAEARAGIEEVVKEIRSMYPSRQHFTRTKGAWGFAVFEILCSCDWLTGMSDIDHTTLFMYTLSLVRRLRQALRHGVRAGAGAHVPSSPRAPAGVPHAGAFVLGYVYTQARGHVDPRTPNSTNHVHIRGKTSATPYGTASLPQGPRPRCGSLAPRVSPSGH